MARVAVTCTVIFLLFAFSNARSPLVLPENEDGNHDPSITLPESDTKATILLPSEKPDTEPNTVVELEPETTEFTPLVRETEPNQDIPQSETESGDEFGLNQPLTIVTFRPSNRHFPQIRGDRQSPFRLPHRCRHHHHRHHFGGAGPQFNGGRHEISYGNDMIVPKVDSKADAMFHGDHFGGVGPQFNGGRREMSYDNDMIIPKEDINADPMFHGDHHHGHHIGGVGPQFNGERREMSYGNDMIIPKDDINADSMFHGDHHHGHHFGGVGPQFNGGKREMSYGNDMINPKEDINADPMFHDDEMRKIPARWARFHHHGKPRFPFRHEKWNKEEMKRRFHHMEDDEVAEKEHMEGGLMNRIRKFLNHL